MSRMSIIWPWIGVLALPHASFVGRCFTSSLETHFSICKMDHLLIQLAHEVVVKIKPDNGFKRVLYTAKCLG